MRQIGARMHVRVAGVLILLAGCTAAPQQAMQAPESCAARQGMAAAEAARLRAAITDQASPATRQYLVAAAEAREKIAATPCPEVKPTTIPATSGAAGAMAGMPGAACERVARRKATAAQVDRDAEIDAGLCWIERNSPYRNIPPPRFWLELDKQQMRTRSINAGMRGGIYAMYNCHERAVYFPAGADMRLIVPQSALVHELVHHAQCVNHRPRGDGCEYEREAYFLQAGYVRFVAENSVADVKAEDRQRLHDLARQIEDHADKACRNIGVSR